MRLQIVTFVTIFFCLLLLGLASLVSHLSRIKAYPVMGAKIKKRIRFSLHIPCRWNGELKIQRALPNKFAQAIGPFVLFEHIRSFTRFVNESHRGLATNRSQAHRGIAILTYILIGEVEHLDSTGHHEKLGSGGVHWTKAGKGIVYDEIIRSEVNVANPHVSVVRLWTNLTSKHKADRPVYSHRKPTGIPKRKLDDDAGWIKIILGVYEDKVAKIPYYSKEFLYHIHLEAGRQFSTTTDAAIEYAVFLPANKAVVNGKAFKAGELILFASFGAIIEIKNSGKTAIDIILFGGDPYNEPIVSEENFVMNNPHEISQAYNDYYDGKYGQIKPKQKK
jgi:redox-sensitive bicupin YhaK (pirin superfamily)